MGIPVEIPVEGVAKFFTISGNSFKKIGRRHMQKPTHHLTTPSKGGGSTMRESDSHKLFKQRCPHGCKHQRTHRNIDRRIKCKQRSAWCHFFSARTRTASKSVELAACDCSATRRCTSQHKAAPSNGTPLGRATPDTPTGEGLISPYASRYRPSLLARKAAIACASARLNCINSAISYNQSPCTLSCAIVISNGFRYGVVAKGIACNKGNLAYQFRGWTCTHVSKMLHLVWTQHFTRDAGKRFNRAAQIQRHRLFTICHLCDERWDTLQVTSECHIPPLFSIAPSFKIFHSLHCIPLWVNITSPLGNFYFI